MILIDRGLNHKNETLIGFIQFKSWFLVFWSKSSLSRVFFNRTFLPFQSTMVLLGCLQKTHLIQNSIPKKAKFLLKELPFAEAQW